MWNSDRDATFGCSDGNVAHLFFGYVEQRITWIKNIFRHNFETQEMLLQKPRNASLMQIGQVAKLVLKAITLGGKPIIFGNGGSAADAQHLAAEFVGRFVRERCSLPALALNTDLAAITAIGNDFGYDAVFDRQITALGNPSDVAMGITTSGNSKNVIQGIAAAKKMGLTTVALTGQDGGMISEIADHCVKVPATNTALIQELHMAIGHLICQFVDDAVTGKEEMLLRTCSRKNSKLVTLESFKPQRDFFAESDTTVVWTNGCFDLMHAGHLSSLETAASYGDVLVVGVNSDAAVRALKGANRPIVQSAHRTRMLAGLSCVDFVIEFDDLDPCRIIQQLKPNVHVKGEEYAPEYGRAIPEKQIIESYGGTIAFSPHLHGISTTIIENSIKAEITNPKS